MAQAQSRYTVVAVMNRADFPITNLQYDSEVFDFAPRETKHLTIDCARHLIRHSTRKWDPVTDVMVQALVEVKPGDPEPEVLTYEEGNPGQLLDTSNMPPTHFDDQGNPMRGELKNLGTPTGMLRGRIPAGANAGVPAVRGAAGSGLGAKEPMPAAIAEGLAAGTERLADELGIAAEG